MEAIRVLQVFTILNRGGAESMIMNYYRSIDRSKIQFDFLVHRKERGVFEDEIEELGGKVYRIRKINPFFSRQYYADLDLFFKEHDYKIVHSHINTFSSFVLKIARNNNVPCRITHSHIALENLNFSSIFKARGNFKEFIKNAIKQVLKKNVKTYSTHLFSCGDKAGEWLFGKGANFYVMNNAIDLDKFRYNNSTRSNYMKRNDLDGKIIFGHVGRFNKQKNHDFLINVFYEIQKIKSNSVLLLIGDGNLRNDIENKVEKMRLNDKVLFLGVRTDIAELLQLMDAFVFPSLYEGLPVTLIEAQSASLKVFCSDTITDEVKLTDKIKFLSLNESSSFWAETIFKGMNSERSELAIGNLSAYDIREQSKRYLNFCLEQYERNKI